MRDKIPSPVLAVIAIVALMLAAGCGDNGRPEGDASAPSGAAREPRPAAAEEAEEQGRPETGEGVALRVLLQEAGSEKPVPSARMTVYVQAGADPRTISTQEIWTDGEGRAEHFLPEAHRLAVKSEYCTRPTEVAFSGGEAAAVLSVTVRFPVSGRVIDPAGRPLAGAAVLLFIQRAAPGRAGPAGFPLLIDPKDLDEFQRLHARDLAGRVLTGADGKFEAEMSVLRPLAAAAALDGFVTADWRGIPFNEELRRFDPVTIVLRPAAELKVRFLSTRGAVIPGRAVRVREAAGSEHGRRFFESVIAPFVASSVPGDDGFARFMVPSGIDLVVESRFGGEPALMYPVGESGAGEPDFLRDLPLETARLEAGGSQTLTATPKRNVRLACSVRDGEGAPVPGAALLLPGKSVRTGDDGLASLLVPYNAALGVPFRIEKEGCLDAEGSLTPPAAGGREIVLETTLEKARPLIVDSGKGGQRVWLLDETGTALSGSVEKGGENLMPEEALIRFSRKEGGSWVFSNPGRGKLSVFVQTGPFSFHAVRGIEAGSGTAAVDLPMILPGVVLEGRVLFSEGSSPQAVTVTVMRNDLPEVRRFDPFDARGSGMGWASAPVGKDGAFRFEGLVPGRYALAASLVEWGVRTDLYGEVEVRAGDDSLSVVMNPSRERGSAEIRVIDKRGDPLAGVDLLLLDPVDSPLAATPLLDTHFISDDDGRIEIDDLPPGRYGFVISGRDLPGAPVSGRVLVEAGRRADVSVRITP